MTPPYAVKVELLRLMRKRATGRETTVSYVLCRYAAIHGGLSEDSRARDRRTSDNPGGTADSAAPALGEHRRRPVESGSRIALAVAVAHHREGQHRAVLGGRSAGQGLDAAQRPGLRSDDPDTRGRVVVV